MKKIILPIILILILIFILMFIFVKPDIRYSKVSFGIETSYQNNPANNEYKWYDSVQESIKDTAVIDDEFFSDIDKMTYICEFENENSVKEFYFIIDEPHHQDIVVEFDILKENGKYSQVVSYKADIANLYEIARYKYRCVDAATQYINLNFSPFVNDDGKKMYIGFWSSKEDLEALNICGKPVDEIYELRFKDDKEIYMWVAYREDMYERLAQGPEEMTYEDEEELLDIYLKE